MLTIEDQELRLRIWANFGSMPRLLADYSLAYRLTPYDCHAYSFFIFTE